MNASVITTSPVVERVRAYFAPVSRSTEAAAQPIPFDPGQLRSFALDQPPSPWVDLGWIFGLQRRSGSVTQALRTGAPAAVQMQVRTEIDETVELSFESWGKLQLSLACGSQSLNVLQGQSGAAASPSGGQAETATALLTGSTATVLQVSPSATGSFAPGQTVVVDLDYTGQTGFLGSGTTGAYLPSGVSDVDYIRRVSLNVGRVASVQGGTVTLADALPAGVPDTAMKLSRVTGFCDREGGSFFAEWSGLFIAEGQQGERVAWYYPRLQAMRRASEVPMPAGTGFNGLRLGAAFRALPIVDPLDNERIVCFRSYLPAS